MLICGTKLFVQTCRWSLFGKSSTRYCESMNLKQKSIVSVEIFISVNFLVNLKVLRRENKVL